MARRRLHVVNPNTDSTMTRKIGAAARQLAAPETEVVARGSQAGPPVIEGYHDGAVAVPGMLAEIAEGEGDGVDVHVIACFDDTGLDAARAAAGAPVVGIGEAACRAVTFVAERFIVVTAARESVPVLEENVRRMGLRHRCNGVVAAEVGVADLAGEEAAVADVVRAAAEADPAAGIVLGCAGMAGMASTLTRELGRPVIDPVAAGVTQAEALVRMELATVKLGGWAWPKDRGA